LRTKYFQQFLFCILYLVSALCEEEKLIQSPTTYLLSEGYSKQFTPWRFLTCETACCITVIQAVSQVKCLQRVNFKYVVGDCETFFLHTMHRDKIKKEGKKQNNVSKLF